MENHLGKIIEVQELVLSKASSIIKNSICAKIKQEDPLERVKVFNSMGKDGIVTKIVEWNIRIDWNKGTYVSKAVKLVADGNDLLVQDSEKMTLVKEEELEEKLGDVLLDSHSKPMTISGTHDGLGKLIKTESL